MTRSLQPGTVLARYRIDARLGAGGMGEVYLARDESLDRSVALKILPPELVRNDERVRRFVQEAKTASSLNHPHIVTIYEIGEADVAAADGAPATRLHFIAMELVSGHTLKTLIHSDKTDLRTLVHHLAQAADGVAKAHASGIVHRDLKPENIMVTADGFAKVLDFGLAKLTEAAPGADLTSAPTALARPTADGVIMGTVGYMSPEQVQARTVDHRSDIFSFGCVLYEAAARQRPFQADSDVETLHKILKEKPAPLEELSPQAPGELRRIIRRCLAKNPEQRLQSMKDLALQLAEIAEEYETLSVSSGSGAASSLSAMGASPGALGGRYGRAIVLAALVVGALGLGAAAWSYWWRGAGTDPAGTFEAMTITRLLSVPDLAGARLSPDGRQLAFGRSQAGQTSLWVRQVATGSDIQVVAPRRRLGLIGFSRDGDYLYFLAADTDDVLESRTLYQVAALGGPPRRLIDDVVDPVTFSPDGREVAFVRHEGTSAPRVVIAGLDGGGERTLTTRTSENLVTAAAWSPDGATLAVATYEFDRAPERTMLAGIAIADGRVTDLTGAGWNFIGSMAWLPDGSAFLVTGAPEGSTGVGDVQVWRVSYADGAVRRVTNDTNNYTGVSLSADGQTLATTQSRFARRLWTAPAANLGAGEAVGGGSDDERVFSVVATGTSVLFTSENPRTGRSAIVVMEADGTGRRTLTRDGLDVHSPLVPRGGGVVVFTAAQADGVPHVWRMDLDGGNLRQLTHGAGESAEAVSPDGQTVLLTMRRGAAPTTTVYRLPISGGTPEKFLENVAGVGEFSPDGQHLLVSVLRDEGGRQRPKLELIPAGGGPAVRSWNEDGWAARWSPSGDALEFVRAVDGATNIWRQPLAGGAARQVTTFTNDELGEYAWTADGRLFYTRWQTISVDAVLITRFR